MHSSKRQENPGSVSFVYLGADPVFHTMCRFDLFKRESEADILLLFRQSWHFFLSFFFFTQKLKPSFSVILSCWSVFRPPLTLVRLLLSLLFLSHIFLLLLLLLLSICLCRGVKPGAGPPSIGG